MKLIKEILPQQIIPEKEVNRYLMEDGKICKSFDEANHYLTWDSKYTKFIDNVLEEKIPWVEAFVKQVIKVNMNADIQLHYILSPEFTEDMINLILSKFTRCKRDNENVEKYKKDHVIYFYLHNDSSHWDIIYVPYDFFCKSFELRNLGL